jgi:23S rRNA (uracil1939-C5)-methyltransferase
VAVKAQEVEIDGLGAQGDGIVELPEGLLYIPYALPGELWRVADGERYALLRPHPERVDPVCPHFGSCGGCEAQHMPDAFYAGWKRAIVVEAFRHRGIDAPVDELFRVPLASRRRINVYARRYRKNLHLGFYRAATHYIMNVMECPIAMPQLVAVLPALRGMLEPLLTGQAEAAIDIVATAAGVDVQMDFIYIKLENKDLARMAALAVHHSFARLAINGETVAMVRPPALTFGGVDVDLPHSPFVQAVGAAEAEMVRLVLAATAKAKRVADLFCGLGTFTFPLARRARVLAVDEKGTAIVALQAAARRTQGLKPIETKVRDLSRMPLSAKELEDFDAVVFDPARSGAEEQARQLARSKVRAVVAVSCNPGTLARDVRILVDGGYALERVTPIDQFLFSHHVEAVAVLRR